MKAMTRRELLVSLPALALAPRVLAQSKPTIVQKGFSHFTPAVSDLKRSVDFYQSHFGMPIQARQGDAVILRIGQYAPKYVAGRAPAGVRHRQPKGRRGQDDNSD